MWKRLWAQNGNERVKFRGYRARAPVLFPTATAGSIYGDVAEREPWNARTRFVHWPENFCPWRGVSVHDSSSQYSVNTCATPIMHSSFQALYIPETFAGRPCIYLRIEIYRGQPPLLSFPLYLSSPSSLLFPLFLFFTSPSDRDSGFVCTLLKERSKSSTGTRDCVNFPPPGWWNKNRRLIFPSSSLVDAYTVIQQNRELFHLCIISIIPRIRIERSWSNVFSNIGNNFAFSDLYQKLILYRKLIGKDIILRSLRRTNPWSVKKNL